MSSSTRARRPFARLGGWGRLRPAAAWAGTIGSVVLVMFALVVPNAVASITPGSLVRIPLEAVLGVAVLAVLPARPRRVVAVLIGVVLGLMSIVKLFDMGFYSVLGRPFDPILDWSLLQYALDFLSESIGGLGAWAVVVGAVVVAAAALALTTLAVLHLTRVLVRHHAIAPSTVTAVGAVWVTLALLGAQIVPGVPVAARSNGDRLRQVRAALQDRQKFAELAAVDAFRNTPGDQLLTALRGKDVIVGFIESYGRDAVEDPEFATQIGAVLDDGTKRLRAAGYSARSGFLTSPTAGGHSWLAHSTLLSGLWIDNQQRYRSLVSTDRLTLNSAFRRASWQTVAVMPANTEAWPEGEFYGYHRVYDANNIGYRGPNFDWVSMPDQYTLSAFERAERAKPDRPPVMAEIALISSHMPWAPLPQLIGWDDVGDGAVYESQARAGNTAEEVWRDNTRVRTEYRRSIEYSLNTLVSYVETYGDDDLVLVFLGDHQPAPLVTGDNASRDVPITIVARDRAVMERIAGWNWQDGLKPGPQAPVWPMSDFRDRFLTAFGPQT